MAAPSSGSSSFLLKQTSPYVDMKVPHYKPEHLPFSIPHWHGPNIEQMTNDDWFFQFRVACEFFRDDPDYAWALSYEDRSRQISPVFAEECLCLIARVFYNVELYRFIFIYPGNSRDTGDPICDLIGEVKIHFWDQKDRDCASRKGRKIILQRKTFSNADLFGSSHNRDTFKKCAPIATDPSYSIAFPLSHYQPRILAQKLRSLLTPPILKTLPLRGSQGRPQIRPIEYPHHYTMYELILYGYLDL